MNNILDQYTRRFYYFILSEEQREYIIKSDNRSTCLEGELHVDSVTIVLFFFKRCTYFFVLVDIFSYKNDRLYPAGCYFFL